MFHSYVSLNHQNDQIYIRLDKNTSTNNGVNDPLMENVKYTVNTCKREFRDDFLVKISFLF